MTPVPLKSRRLAAAHGFFGRQGGVSTGLYASLNCGRGSADAAAAVTENRQRTAAALNLPAASLRSAYQVHSADAAIITLADDPSAPPKADALVTRLPGLALAILTADCAPILFHDPDAGVIAAAHAGWKGALYGIIESTVRAMETIGATRTSIVAVIGPCISQRAYEVGPEFLDRFLVEDAEFAAHFAQSGGDRLQFDLPGFVLRQLRAAGLTDPEWTGHCTLSDADRFFSYRRTTKADEPDYGRQLSVISL